MQAAFQAAQNAHADAKRECANAKSKVQQATNELHHIQRSSGPHQDAIKFDDQAGPLLDAIHKNKQRFRMPVLGPVGACLSLEASANKCACRPSHCLHTTCFASLQEQARCHFRNTASAATLTLLQPLNCCAANLHGVLDVLLLEVPRSNVIIHAMLCKTLENRSPHHSY